MVYALFMDATQKTFQAIITLRTENEGDLRTAQEASNGVEITFGSTAGDAVLTYEGTAQGISSIIEALNNDDNVVSYTVIK